MSDRRKPAPRELEVLHSQRLTPHMLRLTLGGPGMDRFPEPDLSGGYVKLMISQEDGASPLIRTYTIRAHRPGDIDVDVVLHDDHGPASRWAMAAVPGSRLMVGGPGPSKPVDEQADWCLMVADMTALPALAVHLETMASTHRGAVFIEVTSEDDIQSLAHPEGMVLHWVINPRPGTADGGGPLIDAVRAWPWPDSGRGFVWGACEFSGMRALRYYTRQVRGLERRQCYISSYWKHGMAEDDHKVVKREDADQDAQA
ncbi:siderophore-interacting protein [Larsenimonas rhizosphaerae]|uniref:Siderophore-interacting protein n=1 Tax=Larsenimonas rhizosphaerae TaxID=2944682 RepID=A0AA41ZHM7_9GAMM|nr:siderophore-interacting protein [Larsenimonas rhizosphaerae]MCX2524028.1 siderophore-interacting protein [Larsenimonas rhizosphaerae]